MVTGGGIVRHHFGGFQVGVDVLIGPNAFPNPLIALSHFLTHFEPPNIPAIAAHIAVSQEAPGAWLAFTVNVALV